jgi:general secretion pathway protein E
MLKTKVIHNTALKPYEIKDIDMDIALKYYVLFAKDANEEVIIALNPQKINESFGYLSKFEFTYKIIFLDEDSYEKLYNQFLELKTDKAIESFQEEDDSQSEDDISLTEFLRNSSDILSSEESAPIIKFVNALFYHAIKKNASDIHIESHEFKGEVRFRIDGVLFKHVELDNKIVNLIIRRIKVISNLDISENRIPQDGRTQIKVAKKSLDVRVSTLPTFYGERVVMRILMQSVDIPSIEKLGFDENTTEKFREFLKFSHGIILVTGPTGSGKSTTLHSFLQELASPDKNIITVEDPIEYKADNINQIQVNSQVGLTFATGLRSILRQDPDVIMIGEIRDPETAKIAIQSALTGHLVFSTLHTNNATSAITRLVDMQVETFLVSSTLVGVLAQRLVRVLCPDCKKEDDLAEEHQKEFKIPKDVKLYKPIGCEKCRHTGFVKRKAIGELFELNDTMKHIIKENNDDITIREKAISLGFITIQEQLIQMLIDGETSLEEAIRVGLKE